VSLVPILTKEIETINGALRDLGVRAACAPGRCIVAGGSHIVYGVALAPAVFDGDKIALPPGRPDQVAKAIPLIAERLSALRRRACPVRLRELPLALEVQHLQPAPLSWRQMADPIAALRPHQGVVGRSWDETGGVVEVVDLAQSPHVLVAGTTNSGKSTLALSLLASLACSTSPDQLQVYVVDLKNEDFTPLVALPHVRGLAVDLPSAVAMVREIEGLKADRVAAGLLPDSAPRVVLAIDELAQLADEGALTALGSVLSVGRSKRINVIAATQKPTAAVISSQGRANFALRLVGQVVDATESATATGRSEAGAQFLPGPGAFLRVEGADLRRFASYDLRGGGVEWLIGRACALHGAASPGRAQAAPVGAGGVPADVAALFGEYALGDGSLRRGWKAAAVRLVAGVDVAGGRAYQAAADQVDRYFDMWRSCAAAD